MNSLLLTLNYIIHFTDNQIGDDGAKAISEALKTNQSITHINLSCMNTNSHFQLNSLSLTLNYIFHFIGNKIGDDGARAISEALKTNQSITYIDLSGMNTTHIFN